MKLTLGAALAATATAIVTGAGVATVLPASNGTVLQQVESPSAAPSAGPGDDLDDETSASPAPFPSSSPDDDLDGATASPAPFPSTSPDDDDRDGSDSGPGGGGDDGDRSGSNSGPDGDDGDEDRSGSNSGPG